MPENDESLFVTLARLEAKVDVALARQGAKIDEHDEDISDHERRIRALEAQPHIKPFALWTAILGGGGFLVAIAPYIAPLFGG